MYVCIVFAARILYICILFAVRYSPFFTSIVWGTLDVYAYTCVRMCMNVYVCTIWYYIYIYIYIYERQNAELKLPSVTHLLVLLGKGCAFHMYIWLYVCLCVFMCAYGLHPLLIPHTCNLHKYIHTYIHILKRTTTAIANGSLFDLRNPLLIAHTSDLHTYIHTYIHACIITAIANGSPFHLPNLLWILHTPNLLWILHTPNLLWILHTFNLHKYIHTYIHKADCVWVGRRRSRPKGKRRFEPFENCVFRVVQTWWNGIFPSPRELCGQLKRKELYMYYHSHSKRKPVQPAKSSVNTSYLWST